MHARAQDGDRWTEADRRFLSAIGCAEEEAPRPVVSIDMYLTAVRSAQFATDSAFRERHAKKLLWRRYCRQWRALVFWRSAATLMGLMWIAWILGEVSGWK